MAEQECSTATASADPEEEKKGSVYGGWRDSFRLRDEKVERPSLSEFLSVLKELSPTLVALQVTSLEFLAEKGFALEQQGDEVLALQLYNQMFDILVLVLEQKYMDTAEVPDFVPNFAWVFTWVKVHLLYHSMLSAPGGKEQLDADCQWWTFLHLLWPDDGSCEHTKRALDTHRRMALLECGHETEAVVGFESPSPWVGFNKAFLLYSLSCRHSKISRNEKAVEWIVRAVKAVPETHERAPYINLKIQMWKAQLLDRANLSKQAEEARHRFLRDAQSVDLRAVVGEDPAFAALKLELLADEFRLSYHEGRVEVSTERTLVPDALQSGHPLEALLLRGNQLRAQGRFADALRELENCLAMLKERKSSVDAWQWLHCDIGCRFAMLSCLGMMSAGDGIDRTQEMRAIAREGLRGVLEQIHDPQWWKGSDPFLRVYLAEMVGFLSSEQYWLSVAQLESAVPYRNDESRAAEFDDAVKAYLESWEDCCCSSQIWFEEVGQRLRNTWSPEDSSMTNYSKAYMMYYEILVWHILWTPSDESSDYFNNIARRALLCSERARACAVLPHDESQPELLRDEQALETTEWDRIKICQGICGPGTIFLVYVGWRKLSVCIVDSDGTVSTKYWEGSWRDTMQERVSAVLSAMHRAVRGKKQTADEVPVNDNLEDLYEKLMEPVLATLKEPMKEQHKLIIVASGIFANVPFTLLRNNATGRYLFQEVTVSVTPSLRLLHGCNKRYVELQKRPLNPGEGAAVAVGDPAYKFPTLRLQESEKEVTAISNLFSMPSDAYKVAVLLQEKATVEGLLEWVRKATRTADGTKYSQGFVHIAAHAKVDDRQHPRGALQLAATRSSRGSSSGSISNAGGRDAAHVRQEEQANRETAAEEVLMTPSGRSIAEAAESEAESVRAGQTLNSLNSYLPSQNISTSGTEWSAYMAVLSACNTATGQEVEAGTLNLGRAFITAGVPCTVLSLWPVQDCSTSHLMQLFYKQLKHGEDASTALRSAMLIMLNEGGYGLHQIAPFVVSGLPTVRLPPQLRAI